MSQTINLGHLTLDEYRSRRSTTLINNPDAELDEKFEIDSYLSKLNPEYLKEIKSLSNFEKQPLSNDVRIIVTIVAYNEGPRIKDSLEKYLGQDIQYNKLEIIVLDNHPESVPRDKTVSEVESFKKDNPQISIIYAYKIWRQGDYATIGNARKYSLDIALSRIHDRGEEKEETILITHDADTIRFEPNYFSSILEEFYTNKKVEALVTPTIVPPYVVKKPNMFAALELWDVINDMFSKTEPRNLIGRSSAYRASTYSAVGGYNPRGKLAGDIESGWLIADARNWDPGSVIIFKKTKHYTNPRRILEAAANRVSLYEMYDKFVSRPEIRDADNETLLTYIPDQLDWELLDEEIDCFWHWRKTGMYRWRGDDYLSDFDTAMNHMGLEYVIEGENAKLTNVDKYLEIFEKEFGRKIEITHSTIKKLTRERHQEIINYFSTISDSPIASRKEMAEKIAKEIKDKSHQIDRDSLNDLLKKYRRFAGHDYNEKI